MKASEEKILMNYREDGMDVVEVSIFISGEAIRVNILTSDSARSTGRMLISAK